MYRNVFHAAHVIVKKHGIRGAYQGLPATWLRNIPANSAFFGEFCTPVMFLCYVIKMLLLLKKKMYRIESWGTFRF